MIELLDRLKPPASVAWAVYTMPAQVDWLHSDKRVIDNPDQVYPSSGPSTIIPTAIFSIETYEWEMAGW